MKVVHCKKDPYDVYIGRPSKWGNPFEMKDQSANERYRVIEQYREWIKTQPELLNSLHELEGKTLGCWCSPKRCHGDILVNLVEGNRVYREMKEIITRKLGPLVNTPATKEALYNIEHNVKDSMHLFLRNGYIPIFDEKKLKVEQQGNIIRVSYYDDVPYRLDFKIPEEQYEDS